MDSPIDLNQQAICLDYLNKSNLEIHLQAIVDALTSFHGAKDDFVIIYPAFKTNRVSCISLQNEIADSLDKQQFKCDISATASVCVSMIGTAVGGAALVIGTGGLATPAVVAAAPLVAAAGGVSALTGGLTAMGTYVAQTVIEKKYVDKVKTLLERDKMYSERLLKWIKRTEDVIAAVENIMNYNIFNEILKALKIDIEKYKSFKYECNSKEIPQNLKSCIKNMSISENQKNNLNELLLHIMENKECLDLLLTIAALYYTVNPAIQQAYHAFEFSIKVFRCLDATFDIGNAALTIARNARQATKLLIAAGFLSAINFTIDLYTLIKVSRSISSGSKSELAKKIKDCAKLLQEELDTLEIIYQELTVRNIEDISLCFF